MEYKCEMCGNHSHKIGTCCGMVMKVQKNKKKQK